MGIYFIPLQNPSLGVYYNFMNQEQLDQEEPNRKVEDLDPQSPWESFEVAPDLEAYIRLNKLMVLSQEDPEMSLELKKNLEALKGKYLCGANPSREGFLKIGITYVDKDGNLAAAGIDQGKISAYDNIVPDSDMDKRLTEDLKKLGFNLLTAKEREENIIMGKAFRAARQKRERLEQESKEKNKGEFNL